MNFAVCNRHNTNFKLSLDKSRSNKVLIITTFIYCIPNVMVPPEMGRLHINIAIFFNKMYF